MRTSLAQLSFVIGSFTAACSGSSHSGGDVDASAASDAAAFFTDAPVFDLATRMDATADAASHADGGPAADSSLALDATSDAFIAPDAAPDASCVIGSASSTATTSELDLFGTPAYFNDGAPLAAGRYRLRYVEGCMKYGSGQDWTVNAYAADYACWYVIGATTDVRYVVPPGAVGYIAGSGAYANFAECEAASRLVDPVEFDLAEDGLVGVWLFDSPYSDNQAGEGGVNPRWTIERVGGGCE